MSFSFVLQYIPAVDDLVIGIVTERHAEDWKVDIACHQPATLSMYNFENVTRRNRPNINVCTTCERK